MTLKEVGAWVEKIREMATNPSRDQFFVNEEAHVEEDNLHRAVLMAIANGVCEDPQACAGVAIETLGLSFDRWYS